MPVGGLGSAASERRGMSEFGSSPSLMDEIIAGTPWAMDILEEINFAMAQKMERGWSGPLLPFDTFIVIRGGDMDTPQFWTFLGDGKFHGRGMRDIPNFSVCIEQFGSRFYTVVTPI